MIWDAIVLIIHYDVTVIKFLCVHHLKFSRSNPAQTPDKKPPVVTFHKLLQGSIFLYNIYDIFMILILSGSLYTLLWSNAYGATHGECQGIGLASAINYRYRAIFALLHLSSRNAVIKHTSNVICRAYILSN